MKPAKFLPRVAVGVISLMIAAQPALAVSPATRPGRMMATPMPPTTPPGVARACQSREAAIKSRMTSLTDMADNMMTVFDRHATAVENFYTNTVLPKGKTVSNYDALVTDINAKRTDVQNTLTKAQADVNGFSCTSGLPSTQFFTFRQDMQAVKSALKNFRTSIKNLIVAVARVSGTEESPKPSASPETSK